MATFLINASNLKEGGGVQVAQSICDRLRFFPQHHFIVVLSSYINEDNILWGSNVSIFRFTIKHSFKTVLLGRCSFLDDLIMNNDVDSVLTVFGPSIWRPRVAHLCGFARAQILLKDSPYYLNRSLREKILYKIWSWGFRKSSNVFYTENPYISKMLEHFYTSVRVFTVTNYYNQIYDNEEQWKRDITLPRFDGITCLSIAYPTPHKNFSIIEEIIRYYRMKRGEFNIRFVLTCNKEQLQFPDDIIGNIVYVGKVGVSQCPYLYEQCDIMFMPTLMECFTATYPEAMRMEKPIVTTNLDFARGLCGDAACYYSAVDATAAAEAIYKVSTDKVYAKKLVENGKIQLLSYDNYSQRAEKLIKILEGIMND